MEFIRGFHSHRLKIVIFSFFSKDKIGFLNKIFYEITILNEPEPEPEPETDCIYDWPCLSGHVLVAFPILSTHTTLPA